MQKIIKIISKLVLILLLIIPALAIQIASKSDIVIGLTSLVQEYLLWYLLALLSLKSLSIVYPPLPGMVFTVTSIPLIGWQLAYLIDILGSALGTTIAFFLGQKYGYTILKKVIGKEIANKVVSTKLKQNNQVEAAFFLRFAAGGILSDGLAWGASLIGFKYASFIVGYIASHLMTTLPIFYFIATSISFNSWIIVSLSTIIAWLIIYKFKGKYFE